MWVYAIPLGALAGLGLFLIVRELIPGQPKLQAAIDRIEGHDRPAPVALLPDERLGLTQSAGAFAARTMPLSMLRGYGPSDADLDLIGKSRTTLYGEKALVALIGLLFMPLLAVALSFLGIQLPIAVPLGFSLVLAVGGWFLADFDAKSKAKLAREEFARAVGTYLELIAMERISGAGAVQATFGAAAVAHSWPFERITQTLDRGRLAGKAPWTALNDLGQELAIDELSDVADIMEQAGREGAAVYDQLAARADAMRDEQLAAETVRAHAASVRMTVPGVLTILVYFAMLIYPFTVAILEG